MTVYFIQAGEGGPVKIGWTTNLSRRLCALQGAHYENLSVIRTLPGKQALEAYFHERFSKQRIRGEWHSYHPEMMTLVPASPISEEPQISKDEALERAIARAGGPAALARHIGIRTQAVSQWGRAPAERVLEIERAVAGAVSRHELRPDVFGVGAAVRAGDRQEAATG